MRILLYNVSEDHCDDLLEHLKDTGHECFVRDSAVGHDEILLAGTPDLVIVSARVDLIKAIESFRENGIFVLALVEDLSDETLSENSEFPADDFMFVPLRRKKVRIRLRAILETIRRRKEQTAALAKSEGLARAILEETVDGIITIDISGIVASFNPAAETIFGYEAAEVIGRNISFLMPEPYRSEHNHYISNYLKTGERKIIGIGREVVGLRKDGTTFPMELAVSEVLLENKRLFSGIVRDVSVRRRLEREILHISEQERRRIGQDLHDGLGQMLTGIGLLSESLTQKLRTREDSLIPEAEKITNLIGEADEYARLLARGLVPVQLEANGLQTALGRLAVQAERIFRISCSVEASGTMPHHTDNIAVHLYRIAQEAVSNAVKHGKAEHVKIRLAVASDRIRLRILDDGVGFPQKLGRERGMGVYIMHHRARIINASLEIHGDPNGGTTVSCTVPLKHAFVEVAS